MSAEEKLLTVTEAAAYMNQTEVTIKRWARESLLQSVKKNGEFMFKEEALQRYMDIAKKLG